MSQVKILSSDYFEQQLKVEWTVKDVKSIRSSRESPLFSADFCNQFKWRLFVMEDTTNCGPDEQKKIGLFLKQQKVNKVSLGLMIGVVDKEGQLSKPSHWICNFREVPEGLFLGFVDFFKDENLDNFLVDGDLTLQAHITYLDPVKSSCYSAHDFQRLQFYNRMIDNATSDFKITTNDGKVLGVHKAILKNAWPFFAKEVRKEESYKKNKWTAKHSDYESMRIIVLYMYTGHLEPFQNIETAHNVMRAADHYELDLMIDAAKHYLIKNVNASVVLDLLETSDSYAMEDLEKTCVATILKEVKKMKRGVDGLLELPGWSKFDSGRNKQLVAELRKMLLLNGIVMPAPKRMPKK